MPHLLDQLYKTKLQLIAVITVVLGVALLVAARGLSMLGAGWWNFVPAGELGATIFATGLLAIFFEYVDRKHGDKRTAERIRVAVRKEALAIRDAVLGSFAFNADALKGVASDETLDRIAANSLALRLGDQALAEDVYSDLRDQVIRAPERWRDLRVTVTLAPWDYGLLKSDTPPMFTATIRREYRVRPASRTMRFGSVSSQAEYRELLQDPTMAGQWYFEPVGTLNASDEMAFALVQLTVNGKERPIRRTTRKDAQTYTVDLGPAAAEDAEVDIAYTYVGLVQQHGHLLYLDIPRPTKGLQVQLNYQDSGIRFVNTLDFIASSERPRIIHSPGTVPTKSVNIRFDSWVFPRSGVAFVWVVDRELPNELPTTSG